MPRFLRNIGLIFSAIFIFATIVLAAEEITITTYYPSPYGSYNSLQTDKLGVGDNNSDGFLNSADVPTTSGDVWIKGKVGIGIIPTQKLDVAGYIKAQHPFFIASSTDCWRSGSGWNTVVHTTVIAGNSGGWYNTGNGRFTAPVKGIYLFTAQHYVYSAASGAAYIHHLIGVNGNWNGAGYSSAYGSYTIFGMNMGTYDSSTSTTTLLYLNAGDYVNDNVYVSSAANYMCGYHSLFEGVLLYAQ